MGYSNILSYKTGQSKAVSPYGMGQSDIVLSDVMGQCGGLNKGHI